MYQSAYVPNAFVANAYVANAYVPFPYAVSAGLPQTLENYQNLEYGSALSRGKRATMEDFVSVYQTENMTLFGIFDGHGGKRVASTCASGFLEYLATYLNIRGISSSRIKEAFVEFDKTFRECFMVGSTAGMSYQFNQPFPVVLVVCLDCIYTCNIGDSEALSICEDGSNYEVLTVRHDPLCTDEKQRITQVGGSIRENRVDGVINVTRAFGDYAYSSNMGNKLLIPQPSIKLFKRERKTIILGSDGLWGYVSYDATVNLCNRYKEIHQPLNELANALVLYSARYSEKLQVHESVKQGSTDNISVIVVDIY